MERPPLAIEELISERRGHHPSFQVQLTILTPRQTRPDWDGNSAAIVRIDVHIDEIHGNRSVVLLHPNNSHEGPVKVLKEIAETHIDVSASSGRSLDGGTPEVERGLKIKILELQEFGVIRGRFGTNGPSGLRGRFGECGGLCSFDNTSDRDHGDPTEQALR
jgi:hypothetical protein